MWLKENIIQQSWSRVLAFSSWKIFSTIFLTFQTLFFLSFLCIIFLKGHTRGVCGPLLTYGHAVVVQLIPAALLTHSQTLLIQHVQQTDRTHLFFLILHTAKMDTPTPSSALPHWPFLTLISYTKLPFWNRISQRWTRFSLDAYLDECAALAGTVLFHPVTRDVDWLNM